MARALTYAQQFDPKFVDPRLIEILERAAAQFGDYGVEAFSGKSGRPSTRSRHPVGEAVDVRLRDKKTRAALANYQTPETFSSYEAFAKAARKAQQELYPDLDKDFRWGGYFGGGKDKYGALDLMHFDVTPGGAMGGGSWAGGLTPEQAAIWGLPAGTTEALAQQPPDVQRAFLSTIAGTESPGYDVLYGGGKFQGYGQHPNARIPIMSGPNKGDYSTAAGRYQFLKGTWDEQAKLAGVTDFSPGSQDKVAWNYAQAVYKQKTGGSLEEALQSGDPARINAAGQVLSSVWTSLPGGIEQAKGYGTGTFADAYRKNLGTAGPAGPVEAAGGGAGNEAGATVTPAVGAPVADTGTWWEKLARDFGKGGATVAAGLGAQQPARRGPTAIPAARIDQGEIANFDPQTAELQRQRLAEAMQRLNSGKLVI